MIPRMSNEDARRRLLYALVKELGYGWWWDGSSKKPVTSNTMFNWQIRELINNVLLPALMEEPPMPTPIK